MPESRSATSGMSVMDEAGVVMRGGEIPSEPSIEEILPEQVPKTQLQILEDALANAVKGEDYETAAKIRDQIKKMIESS